MIEFIFIFIIIFLLLVRAYYLRMIRPNGVKMRELYNNYLVKDCKLKKKANRVSKNSLIMMRYDEIYFSKCYFYF